MNETDLWFTRRGNERGSAHLMEPGSFNNKDDSIRTRCGLIILVDNIRGCCGNERCQKCEGRE